MYLKKEGGEETNLLELVKLLSMSFVQLIHISIINLFFIAN